MVNMLYQPSEDKTVPSAGLTPATALFGLDSIQGGQTEFFGFKDNTLFAVAQVRNTFIVAHSSDSLYLVDQHAAAEKSFMKNC
jgi:DNA mismatch repair ATPase MutL